MKLLVTLFIFLSFTLATAFSQSSTNTLNDPVNDYIRYQRTIAPTAIYEWKISSGALLGMHVNGYRQFYFGPQREFVVNRLPGVEAALIIVGANNNATDQYVSPFQILTGSTNPAAQIGWNTGIRIPTPKNTSTLTGWSIANYVDNWALPNGRGHAYWYDGPKENGLNYGWNIDGYGNQWTFRLGTYNSSNWEKGGCWWEKDEAEWYCGTKANGSGVKRPFILEGNPVEIEDALEINQTVKIQGQPGFTGSCLSGQSPVFKEGIAVGCN